MLCQIAQLSAAYSAWAVAEFNPLSLHVHTMYVAGANCVGSLLL